MLFFLITTFNTISNMILDKEEIFEIMNESIAEEKYGRLKIFGIKYLPT